jgi:hypothetical protein
VNELKELLLFKQQRQYAQSFSAALQSFATQNSRLTAGTKRESLTSANRQHLTFDLDRPHFLSPFVWTLLSQVLMISTPFSFHNVWTASGPILSGTCISTLRKS